MNKFVKTLIFAMAMGGFALCEAQTLPYQDTCLDVNSRIDDLLNRLTIDEKLSLMEHSNPGIERLGLKPYSWWNEALHGVGRNGLATVWPMPIALAASFDTSLVRDVFALTACEAVEKHRQAQAEGLFGDYTGLTFFTPNINIFRDPRWGRGMETYGEDPFLTAAMGLSCVNGLQHAYNGSDIVTAACLKHFAVHSGPEGLRHQFDAEVTQRDLWTTYLPAFEYIIQKSYVAQVMCAYNRLNGTPCCTNADILVNILRQKWHYDGLLVTDCWALNDCWERDTVIPRHETHATAALAAADAFGSEVDLECGSGLQALKTAVDSGYVSVSKIDEHVRRILSLRMKVIENQGKTNIIKDKTNPETVAANTLVMLKNDGILPLGKQKIFLTGPNANDTLMPLGNYNGTPAHTSTIEEGLRERFTLTQKASKADVIVYAGGLSPQLEGEELPIDTIGFYKGDRTMIELPAAQVNDLKQLRQHKKPIILLLCTGSAIALDGVIDYVDAAIVCWYGGEAMGKAVATALAGESNSFGRLPVTFYKSTRQLPDFADYDMQGRTYRYMQDKPLFPFGYGLSYSTFSLDNISFDRNTMTISGTVRQTECRSKTQTGEAVIQVYLKGDGTNPNKSLVGIAKTEVQNTEAKPFSIKIDPFWLRFFDDKSQEMAYPAKGSKMTLQIGFSSDDNDLKDIQITY